MDMKNSIKITKSDFSELNTEISNENTLFRAKTAETEYFSNTEQPSKWVYGYYFRQPATIYYEKNKAGLAAAIYDKDNLKTYFVDPKTVCQYIGIKDQNKSRIFKSDIIDFLYNNKNYIGVVTYSYASYRIININKKLILFDDVTNLNIIGNIFDTPELIKNKRNGD